MTNTERLTVGLLEERSGGRHFLQMIFSRFCNYVKLIRNNKKPFIRTLYTIVKEDVNTTTGSNIRTVLNTTGVDLRYRNSKLLLSNWKLHPKEDDWTVPLLTSLIELRADKWEVHFDDEDESLQEDEINFMIEAVCIG